VTDREGKEVVEREVATKDSPTGLPLLNLDAPRRNG
jgi:hypothetical protein